MLDSSVGPKADRLTALSLAGFPVPRFCVVPSTILDGFIQSNQRLNSAFIRYRQGFVNKLDILERAQSVANLILTEALPGPLADEVISAVEEAEVCGPWIARSSGNLEDCDGFDLAGAYDSIPDLYNSADLIYGIRRCWASMFGPRALLRFSECSEDVDGAVRDLSQARMNVIVQTQIYGQWSGVVFTADPTTGNEGLILVEAGSGLGDVAAGSLSRLERARR